MPDAQIVKRRALIDAPELLAGIDGVRLGIVLCQRLLAAREPARRPFAGGLGIGILRRIFHALVKRHGDVRAKVGLDAHALLRPHKDLVTIEVGGKRHALFLDFAQLRKRKYLKAAGIRENRAVPRHELMQSAHGLDRLVAGTKMQVIGIRKLDLRADVLQILCAQRALDRGLCADIHENRRLHRSVRAGELAAPGFPLSFDKLEHDRISLQAKDTASADRFYSIR